MAATVDAEHRTVLTIGGEETVILHAHDRPLWVNGVLVYEPRRRVESAPEPDPEGG